MLEDVGFAAIASGRSGDTYQEAIVGVIFANMDVLSLRIQVLEVYRMEIEFINWNNLPDSQYGCCCGMLQPTFLTLNPWITVFGVSDATLGSLSAAPGPCGASHKGTAEPGSAQH